MEKVKKIINSISWVIVALTGILLIVKWNDIPALVITHIGMGISYGSKNILPASKSCFIEITPMFLSSKLVFYFRMFCFPPKPSGFSGLGTDGDNRMRVFLQHS